MLHEVVQRVGASPAPPGGDPPAWLMPRPVLVTLTPPPFTVVPTAYNSLTNPFTVYMEPIVVQQPLGDTHIRVSAVAIAVVPLVYGVPNHTPSMTHLTIAPPPIVAVQPSLGGKPMPWFLAHLRPFSVAVPLQCVDRDLSLDELMSTL